MAEKRPYEHDNSPDESSSKKRSLMDIQTKARVKEIVKNLSENILALPFTKMVKQRLRHQYLRSFDDILEDVEENRYSKYQEVFEDLIEVVRNTISKQQDSRLIKTKGAKFSPN